MMRIKSISAIPPLARRVRHILAPSEHIRRKIQRDQPDVWPAIVKSTLAKGAPVEVPYMFCSDYEIGANALCGQHDQGADMYELTGKWMERFNNTYVFSNFRRDRLFFSPNSVFQGKFGRYLGMIPNVYQHWLFDFWWLQNAYNLTQEQFADMLGISVRTLRNWEQGRRKPEGPAIALLRIAAALSRGDVLGGGQRLVVLGVEICPPGARSSPGARFESRIVPSSSHH